MGSTSGILVVDATWNQHQWCLLLYRDTGGLSLTHRFDWGERSESYLENLAGLQRAGYQLKAIVSDGHNASLKAVHQVFPGVPQQCCLLHLHRQCLLWLTQRPKTLAGQSLRYLVNQLLQVQSIEEACEWNLLLDSWFKLFTDVLQEKTYATQPRTKKLVVHPQLFTQSLAAAQECSTPPLVMVASTRYPQDQQPA